MLASDFFTSSRLKEMRDEIDREGFVADKFLANQPDCPVFGVNLACLYPFPPEIRLAYENLSEQLVGIDPGVYVYPLWETHVTIVTFINFAQHISPTPQRVAGLQDLMTRVAAQIEREVVGEPFDLWMEQPVIARKAAILPLSDPSGAITRIRNRVTDSLARDPSLRTSLEAVGLNVPPLVHSTIMRFKKVPEDARVFLSKFDEIARGVPRLPMRIDEVYITTETKPYMREGKICFRFPIGSHESTRDL
jgi:hypothetical protein